MLQRILASLEGIVANIRGWGMIPVAWLVLTGAGWAQSNPSAEELIRSLKPTEVLPQPSQGRGLHRLMLPSEASPAQAPEGVSMHSVTSQSRTASTNANLPSASLFVQFSTGSSGLTPQGAAVLDELGKALASNALASYRFRVEGHTDTVGAKDYNRALSERRAAVVVAYINRKFGIDESRMVAVGLGSEQLLVQTGDQTPEARNRRVKIVNIGT
jgi:OmpA-OmpF porin, OOP family